MNTALQKQPQRQFASKEEFKAKMLKKLATMGKKLHKIETFYKKNSEELLRGYKPEKSN